MPIYKSSKYQFWPILCNYSLSQPTFLVALFYGECKPLNVETYLEDLLEEIMLLSKNGIIYNKIKYNVCFKAFICDAPARSFLKAIIGHTSKHSCERCTIVGTWEGRIVFNSNKVFSLRTSDNFNKHKYMGSHQIGISPLINANINCIDRFPLDYMHIISLGIVKRILFFLLGKIKSSKFKKLNSCIIEKINNNIYNLRNYMPKEFSRKPRSLNDIHFWKATEFRQFLLYVGPVVLKDALPNNIYNHFIKLSFSISILLLNDDNKRNFYLDYAHKLILNFVHQCKHIYGNTFITYNTHSLIHVVDDVKFFSSSLNYLSAFPFENHLQIIKKMVRGSKSPVVQVAKGIVILERENFLQIKKKKKISFKNSVFMNNDNYIFVNALIDNIYNVEYIDKKYIHNFYSYPFNSTLLNISYLSNHDYAKYKISKSIPNENVDFNFKVISFPYKNGLALFPLLHGDEKSRFFV